MAPASLTATTPVNLTIHSAASSAPSSEISDFLNSNGVTLVINTNVATDFGTATAGAAAGITLTFDQSEAVNGFANATTSGGIGTVLTLNQTLAQYESNTAGQRGFKKAFAAVRIDQSSFALEAEQAGTASWAALQYGDIRNNSLIGPVTTAGSNLIKGKLTARVTSITNTSPEAGRN